MISLPPSRAASLPFSWKQVFDAWRITARPEFTVNITVIMVGIPSLLALHRSPNGNFAARIVIAFGILCVANFFASSINCLADYEGDHLDLLKKGRYSRAIDTVGSNIIWLISFLEVSVVTLGILGLTLRQNNLLLLGLWVVALALAVGYSFEPFKLKRRNWLSALTTVIGGFTLPVLFVAVLLGSTALPETMIVSLLFSAQFYAIELSSQIGDYEEDKAMGVMTPCVRYGLPDIARIVFVIFALASAGQVITLMALIPKMNTVSVALCVITSLCFLKVGTDLWRLTQIIAKAGNNPLQALPTLKQRITIPFWIMLSGWGIAIFLACTMFWR